MFGVVDWLGPRRIPQLATATLLAIGVSGCSSDMSTRFSQDPFLGSPYASASRPEATGSLTPRQAAPYGRVESQPLPQYSSAPLAPPVAAPRSYPSASATTSAGISGGGQGVASYTPPPAPRVAYQAQVPTQVPAQVSTQIPAAPRTVAASTAPATNSRSGTTIIVGTGDTLDGLARRYNVPSSAILAANGYRGPRALQPGQQLVIPRQSAAAVPPSSPAPAAPKLAAAGAATHYVNHGDTLYNVARRHQIPVTQLAAANGLATDARLKVGARLTIPAGAGGPQLAAQPQPVAAPVAAAPVAQPKPVAVAQLTPAAAPAVAAPVQKANLASATTTPQETETTSPVKAAEAVGGLPTFRWPVRGRVIAAYGAKSNGKQNDGINVAVPEGTPVKAAEDGVVAYAGNELKGYGNLVLIRHDNGYVTAYAHASELKVRRGDKITRGQVIGKAGQTGDVASPQLHFEIRKGSSPVDPMQFLNGA
jgi:murein DD-endopeptidase MepM/ murein hydrolase activator NlpD